MATSAETLTKTGIRDDGKRLTNLKRHFSTIGIGDVFLQPPAAPLPLTYLSSEQPQEENEPKSSCVNVSSSRQFMSCEIIGTIKSSPEDFCVREIFPTNNDKYVIDGITNKERESLRIADLHGDDQDRPKIEQKLAPRSEDSGNTKEIPTAQDQTESPQTKDEEVMSMPKGGTTENAKTDYDDKEPPKLNSNGDTLHDFLCRIFTSHNKTDKDIESCTSELIKKLEDLQESGLARIRELSSSHDDKITSQISKVSEPRDVWIPPSLKSFNGSERGALHRAIRTEYPTLQSESAAKRQDDQTFSGGKNHWIRVTYDGIFEELVPYLYKPVEDLINLYRFRNLGFQGARISSRTSSGNPPTTNSEEKKQHRDGRSSNGTQVILRLQPGLLKEKRRFIHHFISRKCKHFETSTVNEIPLNPDGNVGGTAETTTAVVIRWSKNALKSSKKRKRNSQGDSNHSAKAGNTYPHTLCVLKKRQKEHLAAIHELTAALPCRQSDIGLAGIKDMQAVTYQYCTFRDIRPEQSLDANRILFEKGMELGTILKVNWLLNKGDLAGNHFDIVIRDLQRVCVQYAALTSERFAATELLVPCERKHILEMVKRVQKSGFVNFYGEQRLGQPGSFDDVGVRAFDIGRAMLQKNFSMAVDLIMTGRSLSCNGGNSNVDVNERKVRATWKETNGDVQATIKALPSGNSMPRERAVLKGLNRYGKDKPLQALRCMQYNMRVFFLNAYQSYIWNAAATERIKKYGMKAVIGDLYLPEFCDGDEQPEAKVVDGDSVDKVTLAQIVLPLPGYRVVYPKNEIGTLYTRLLEKDGVKFNKESPAEATSKGSYRYLVSTPRNLKVEFESEDAEIANSARLSFELPKGCYATVLLREVMLTTVTRGVK